MIAAAIPLAVVMVLLFTAPINVDANGFNIWTIIYMLFIMCLFDTVYTAFSVNRVSLYPEIFRTDKAREEVGAVRRIIMVIALLLATILPTLMITDMAMESIINSRRYHLAIPINRNYYGSHNFYYHTDKRFMGSKGRKKQ